MTAAERMTKRAANQRGRDATRPRPPSEQFRSFGIPPGPPLCPHAVAGMVRTAPERLGPDRSVCNPLRIRRDVRTPAQLVHSRRAVWGQYAIWQFEPGLKVSMDGRARPGTARRWSARTCGSISAGAAPRGTRTTSALITSHFLRCAKRASRVPRQSSGEPIDIICLHRVRDILSARVHDERGSASSPSVRWDVCRLPGWRPSVAALRNSKRDASEPPADAALAS